MDIQNKKSEIFLSVRYAKLLCIFLLCSPAFCACGQKDGERFINDNTTHTTRVVYESGVCILKERLLKTDTGFVNDGIKEQVLKDGNKQVEYYKVGRPDSLILVYDPSGVLRNKVILYEGGVIGPSHRYFPNGQLEAFRRCWCSSPTTSTHAIRTLAYGIIPALRV